MCRRPLSCPRRPAPCECSSAGTVTHHETTGRSHPCTQLRRHLTAHPRHAWISTHNSCTGRIDTAALFQHVPHQHPSPAAALLQHVPHQHPSAARATLHLAYVPVQAQDAARQCTSLHNKPLLRTKHSSAGRNHQHATQRCSRRHQATPTLKVQLTSAVCVPATHMHCLDTPLSCLRRPAPCVGSSAGTPAPH